MKYIRQLAVVLIGLIFAAVAPSAPAMASTTAHVRPTSHQAAKPQDVVPLATLFSYTLDFTVNLRGRNMSTPNGTFCNSFHATFVQDPITDKSINISIWIDVPNASDVQATSAVAFSTDGATHSHCWSGFLTNNDQYYFRYTKVNDGETVQGAGTVSD